MSNKKVPRHVVIIPDGNRRWAKLRNLHPWQGHKSGAVRFRELLKHLKNTGVSIITTWGWSTENWSRDSREIKMIMSVFAKFLNESESDLIENHIQFTHFGRKNNLPVDIQKQLTNLMIRTREYSPKFYYNLALDYGGRDEILRAVRKMIKNKIAAENVTADTFSQYLDTAEFPDPDLIIRTSGEQRLSGLMPWQSTYSELYFPTVYFPDFTASEFDKALEFYASRSRRFGGDEKK